LQDSIVPIRTESAYLNQKQAAVHCGVSYSTLRRWRAREDFPSPIKIGGILRWRVIDLDRFMASNQDQAVAA
jgi:predicted DNA-binding transcriptional regulator AlpA